jgi:hypothetical protein
MTKVDCSGERLTFRDGILEQMNWIKIDIALRRDVQIDIASELYTVSTSALNSDVYYIGMSI